MNDDTIKKFESCFAGQNILKKAMDNMAKREIKTSDDFNQALTDLQKEVQKEATKKAKQDWQKQKNQYEHFIG